jgi:DNA modification methylase
MTDNVLYYGDKLDVLRRHVADESVDLVYLDPPFNSNATYNVLFAEHSGEKAASQIKAFEDTWRWDKESAAEYFTTVAAGGEVAKALLAFFTLLGESNMMAYLAMMAPRLVELRRVLKPTGSIYLHCDPTASHYLKLLMDAVFGPGFFRNEIIWKRTTAHSSAKRFAPVHDVLFYYSRGPSPTWNAPREPYDEAYLDHYYKFDDGDGRLYWRDNITGAGVRNGETGQPWHGVDVTARGRHWAYPLAELDRMEAEGRIYWPPKGTMPQEKRYRDDLKGKAVPDLWVDVDRINPVGNERLGYPTQKPEALLERVILSSSNEGDVVLDPFCGCGTAIVVAQHLKRRWVGIDITHLAVNLMKHRLLTAFGEGVKAAYKVVGEPTDVAGAQQLAHEDPYQFQWWALGLVGARPVEQKKGADKGIDGRLPFHEGDLTDIKQIILSVKAGHTNVAHVRDLRGVVDREKAAIGVLITMEEPTGPMRKEAASAGFYESPWGKHPRLQIFTVAELLDGRKIDCPPLGQVSQAFKKAQRKAEEHEALAFELES